MPFIDTSALKVVERLPGWYGRHFNSASMTFAHYDFRRGASIHEHFHPQEEVYEVIDGELELTIDGIKEVARPGIVGIVPGNVRHSVKALTDGRAIIVDYPLRTDMGDRRSQPPKLKEVAVWKMKHRIVHALQKYLLNPPIKLALALSLPLPGYALLETRGRKTGKLRRTPVGDGRIGNQFWLVAEHGMNAGYVRNVA